MSTILVDYENVNYSGLRGLDLLTSRDKLVFFYSAPSSNRIRQEDLNRIEISGCEFRTCKLLFNGKDNLDRYISVAVGEYVARGETEIGIVSQDKGYKAIVDYFTVCNAKDLTVWRADNIENVLYAFNNPEDRIRRKTIAERSKMIDLDEYSIRLSERKSISTKIKEALSKSQYWYRAKDVSDFILNQRFDGKKTMYTRALKTFGREEGIAIYNILKKVV